MPHGRSFKVHVPKTFEATICRFYFGHQRYSSFLRDLSKHGFKHISKGPDRNCKCNQSYCIRLSKEATSLFDLLTFVRSLACMVTSLGYYHEFMLRGRFHLCQYMPRCKDARRLDADPVNEPDFYAISAKYPVGEEQYYVTDGVTSDATPPNNCSSKTTSSDIMIPVPASQPNESTSTPSLAQLFAFLAQAVSKSQPVETIQASTILPEVPQAPIGQLVASLSSVCTPVPAPKPSVPNPVVTTLLKTPLATMGGTPVITTTSATVNTPFPPVNNINNNSSSSNVVPNGIMSMLNQLMTYSQLNDNDIVGHLVHALMQKQQQEEENQKREQEAAAKLAVVLAMCLNPSGSMVKSKGNKC